MNPTAQTFQSVPDIRSAAVNILTKTTNDCLNELGYYPGMKERLQQASAEIQRLKSEIEQLKYTNGRLAESLEMSGTRDLCAKLDRYQFENFKLWDDNRKLDAHNDLFRSRCQYMHEEIVFLKKLIQERVPALYDLVVTYERGHLQSYGTAPAIPVATVPPTNYQYILQPNHPRQQHVQAPVGPQQGTANARPPFAHQRAPLTVNTSSHTVGPLTPPPSTSPSTYGMRFNPEPVQRIAGPLPKRSMSQSQPLTTPLPMLQQQRSFSQPHPPQASSSLFAPPLQQPRPPGPIIAHPLTPASSTRSFSSEPVEPSAFGTTSDTIVVQSPPSISAALGPVKRPSISDGAETEPGPSKKQKVDGSHEQSIPATLEKADPEAAEDEWDQVILDYLMLDDDEDPSRKICYLCQQRYQRSTEGEQFPPPVPFANPSNKALLKHLKTVHEDGYLETRKQVIEQDVIKSSSQ